MGAAIGALIFVLFMAHIASRLVNPHTAASHLHSHAELSKR
jgi:hypothetical protein